MAGEQINVHEKRPFTKVMAAFGFAVGVYLILVILQPLLFEGRFGFGSQIAGVKVSGKTAAEAQILLSERWKLYSGENVTVQEQEVLVSTLANGLKAEETTETALSVEERGYFGLSKYFGQGHSAILTYNDEEISKLLLTMYDSVAVKPVDAQITNLTLGTITPEKSGERLMLPESGTMLREGLSQLVSELDVRIASISPMLNANDATALLASAQEALGEPISVMGGLDEKITTKVLHDWLKITPVAARTLVEQDTLLPRENDGYYYLDQNKVYEYVSTLATKVNHKAANATLGIAEGKMVVLTASVTGQELDTAKAINDIEEAVKDGHQVKLSISLKKPEIREDNLAELGIKEQISRGSTDASGSPANRKVNYIVGTKKFNGVLIKPDEEVSFNTILGPVDASTGYLPELVILADKTVPEFGGGLCQVSSTAFRAILNAGLPVLERHAHAYPVGYYKPYGVDATIYLPTPDLRFKNDTGHYILIQTSVVGNKLYFDFYGTKKPGNITFSGNAEATGAVYPVEQVTPTLSDQGVRGRNSFTAVIYRHIYDAAGKLTDNDKFTSKYDSPDKYPH